jgi:hypothetical protein
LLNQIYALGVINITGDFGTICVDQCCSEYPLLGLLPDQIHTHSIVYITRNFRTIFVGQF